MKTSKSRKLTAFILTIVMLQGTFTTAFATEGAGGGGGTGPALIIGGNPDLEIIWDGGGENDGGNPQNDENPSSVPPLDGSGLLGTYGQDMVSPASDLDEATVDDNGYIVFPDENFAAAIKALHPAYADGIKPEEAALIGGLDVSGQNIANLAGIEYFTGLVYLDVRLNSLSELDLTSNVALEELICNGNQLTSLDLSNNVALQELSASSNKLITLDVSENASLASLNVSVNQLTVLDVSVNASLASLSVNGNYLTALDVSENVALNSLSVYGNQLYALDVSQNEGLETLMCAYNQLIELDVSSNEDLKTLNCSNNKLTTLEVSNNVALDWLDVSNNQLTQLDVSNNGALEWLNVSNNKLAQLDVSNNIALVMLSSTINLLLTLDVSNNPDLEYLDVTYNFMPSEDVVTGKENTQLYGPDGEFLFYPQRDPIPEDQGEAYVDQDGFIHFPDKNFRAAIEEMDDGTYSDGITPAQAALITELDVSQKEIASLAGIEYFTGLTSLDCSKNELKSWNILSGNTTLQYLDCSENQLTGLYVHSTALEILICKDNQIDSIVFGTTVLQVLDISRNHMGGSFSGIGSIISTIMSANPSLRELYCAENALTNLYTQNNPALEKLDCSDNDLTSLNVSSNPTLSYLDVVQNRLRGHDDIRGLDMLDLVEDVNFFFDPQKEAEEIHAWIEPEHMTVELDEEAELYADVWSPYRRSFSYQWYQSMGDDFSAIPDATEERLIVPSDSLGEYHYYVEVSLIVMVDGESRPISTVKSNEVTVYVINPDAKAYVGPDGYIVFPDPLFDKAIREIYDYNQGTQPYADGITPAQAALVTYLEVSQRGIRNLAGIEYFTGLLYLYCGYNQLTSLDVSHSTELMVLECEYNQLSSLDVSASVDLEFLNCDRNQLTSLDVSANIALTNLICRNNQLTELDLSTNAALEVSVKSEGVLFLS